MEDGREKKKRKGQWKERRRREEEEYDMTFLRFPTCAYYLVIILTQSLKFFSHDHPCVEVSVWVCGCEGEY